MFHGFFVDMYYVNTKDQRVRLCASVEVSSDNDVVGITRSQESLTFSKHADGHEVYKIQKVM